MARERNIFKKFLHDRIENYFEEWVKIPKPRVENNGKFEYHDFLGYSVGIAFHQFMNVMNISVLLDYNPSH